VVKVFPDLLAVLARRWHVTPAYDHHRVVQTPSCVLLFRNHDKPAPRSQNAATMAQTSCACSGHPPHTTWCHKPALVVYANSPSHHQQLYRQPLQQQLLTHGALLSFSCYTPGCSTSCCCYCNPSCCSTLLLQRLKGWPPPRPSPAATCHSTPATATGWACPMHTGQARNSSTTSPLGLPNTQRLLPPPTQPSRPPQHTHQAKLLRPWRPWQPPPPRPGWRTSSQCPPPARSA
jgi:hypothetical protein